MTWYSPILINPSNTPSWATDARGASTASEPRGAGIGSAWASGVWAWAGACPRPPEPAPASPAAAASATERVASARAARQLRAPLDVLRQMSEAARASGLSESEVWVAAAREWLRRREGEPGAPPATPAAPAQAERPAAASRRGARRWEEIDALLIELRGPAAPAAHEGAPAA